MISTGELMLGKGLLTASALLGFSLWQVHLMRRMKEQDQAERRAAQEREEAAAQERAQPEAEGPPATAG